MESPPSPDSPRIRERLGSQASLGVKEQAAQTVSVAERTQSLGTAIRNHPSHLAIDKPKSEQYRRKYLFLQ
jgi:hypothetical protein